MIVEDGRRLLLSNLRLTAVAESEALWVEDFRSGVSKPASHSAFHASDVFGAAAERITLATAARLSASFPYISTAALLPTEPRTRVVDAGYYDNYGIDLCTGFLREALENHPAWLEANVSGILIIQIRDDESALSEGQADGPKALRTGRGFFTMLARGLEGLTTPLQGFVAARASVMQLRNDAQLDAIARAYRARFNEDFVAHEVFFASARQQRTNPRGYQRRPATGSRREGLPRGPLLSAASHVDSFAVARRARSRRPHPCSIFLPRRAAQAQAATLGPITSSPLHVGDLRMARQLARAGPHHRGGNYPRCRARAP